MKVKAFSTSLVMSLLVSINDANILNLIEKNNLEIQNLYNKSLQSELSFELKKDQYKPYFNLNLSHEVDNTDTVNSPDPLGINKNKYTATLGKNFLTGTHFNIELYHFEYEPSKNEFIAPPSYNQNYLSLNFEQALYPNFIGSQEKSAYYFSQLTALQDKEQYALDKINLIKTKLNTYWNAKALTLQVQLDNALINKYDILSKKIKNKSQSQLAAPGELEQVLAEITTKKQSIKSNRILLDKALQDLKNDLMINANSTIAINTETTPIPPFSFQTVDIKKSLKYKLQKLKTDTAEYAAQSSPEANAPEISLYATYLQQGLESSQTSAMNEFDHADKNKYLIGIKLNHSFGSDSNSLSSRIKNITKDIEKQKMNRIEDELISYFDVLQKQINNAFDEIQTYESVIKYRKSIIAAMERSYQQGRVDIDQVIMALTNEYQAQVNLISAYAKYNLLKYEYDSQFN